MDFAKIARFRKDITIKKHTAGKIVLGFKASLMLNPEVQALAKEAPEKPACIYKTSLNIFTQSVSIEYDAKVIPKDLLDTILSSDDDTLVATSLELLHERIYA